MQKKLNVMRKHYLLFLSIIMATVLTGCSLDALGGQSGNTANQNGSTPPKIVVTNTPVPDPTPASTATTPTTQSALNTQVTETQPTPVAVVSVNWSNNPATEYTLSWTNVRSAPATSSSIVKRDAPSTPVTVYGSTTGEKFGGDATWYRISNQNDAPQYLYSGLVDVNKPAPPPTPTAVVVPAATAAATTPAVVEKVIKISLTTQHAYAYENGNLVHDDLITSGRPELTTPTGTFKIFFKERNATFYPNPAWKGTPLDFTPEHINYALEFYDTGVFIHDATWRAAGDFGPGTENPHTAPDGSAATGSHGCINTTLADAAWYYNWAPIGTTVIVTP